MNNQRSTTQHYNRYVDKIRKLQDAEANDKTQEDFIRDFIQFRQRSQFTAAPYQRSPSTSPTGTPSPKRVTLSPRRTTLEVPNTRQRSHSDPSDRPPVAMIPRLI